MKTRHQNMLNLFVFLMLILFSAVVYKALFNGEQGKNWRSIAKSEKVSESYIYKNVNEQNMVKTVQMGDSGHEEGSANIVTSIVVSYRAFDTLGEILVLFASIAGVGLLMGKRRKRTVVPASIVIQTAIPIVSLLTLLVGIFIILHGHLTPGGGFPGGALIAGGFVFLVLFKENFLKKKILLAVESLAGLGIIGAAFWGTLKNGYFFFNFLPNGNIGELFSGGIVMLLYLLIGIKVASELTSVASYMIGEEETNS